MRVVPPVPQDESITPVAMLPNEAAVAETRQTAAMAGDERRGSAPGVLEAGAFVVEVMMLAALVYVGVVLPGSVVGQVVLAVGLPVVVAVVWGRWLAPREPRRLPYRRGLALKIVLFAMTSVLLAWAGPLVPAIVFFVVTEGIVVAAERGRKPSEPT